LLETDAGSEKSFVWAAKAQRKLAHGNSTRQTMAAHVVPSMYRGLTTSWFTITIQMRL